MTTDEAFADRRARADLAEPNRIMNREGSEPLRPGDGSAHEQTQIEPTPGGRAHQHGAP